MFWTSFLESLRHYSTEIIPALVVGFLLSGLLHEFLPDRWVRANLSGRALKGILYATLIGTLVPVCCWGCLPLAISMRKKGASLGPILALLVATPATSINALIVTGSLLGIKFAAYLFGAVVAMGVGIGLVGNRLTARPLAQNTESCACHDRPVDDDRKDGRPFGLRIRAALKFAAVDMPKTIGKELLLGLVLAALVNSVLPIGIFVRSYLIGLRGYVFAVVLGLLMYMCATMSVPLVDALIRQGMDVGAGFVLLLIGPITSYATILVIWKEFGWKVLAVFLSFICLLAVLLGYLYTLI